MDALGTALVGALVLVNIAGAVGLLAFWAWLVWGRPDTHSTGRERRPGPEPLRERIAKEAPVPEVLRLKSGALVMIRVNDPLLRYVNGSVGTVRRLAEETVMVGDSLYADVGGAKPLGMTAVWKRRTDAQPQWEREWQAEGIIPTYEPDYVVDRLWEITQLRILNHD